MLLTSSFVIVKFVEDIHSAQCFTVSVVVLSYGILADQRVLSAPLPGDTSGNNPEFHLHLSVSACLTQWDRFLVRSIIQMLDHHHINHLAKSDQARIKFIVPIKDRYHLIKYITCQS